MQELPGYESGGGMVLCLKKPIYGLWQSGLQFYERLADELCNFEMAHRSWGPSITSNSEVGLKIRHIFAYGG